jgi:putative ABC transport system ATP-binding protein
METMDREATQATPAGPACEAPDVGAADAVVVARGVTREYGEGDAAVHALRGVDVDMARGHLTAIMGPSSTGWMGRTRCSRD